VTFKVNDLKALLTLVYNRSRPASYPGGATPATRPAKSDLITMGARSPRNAGTPTQELTTSSWQLPRHQGPVLGEDVTFDAQVWNQPMRGFQVQENREVTAAEANELIGVGIT